LEWTPGVGNLEGNYVRPISKKGTSMIPLELYPKLCSLINMKLVFPLMYFY